MRTAQTVNLCIRRGTESVCIERIDGVFVQSLVLRIGGSLPLGLGAAAKALLAFVPADVADDAYQRLREHAASEQREFDVRAVAAEASEIRRQGFAISDEDVTPGIASIGAPIFDYTGKIRAALSIGGLRQQVLDPSADMTAAVVNAAAKVSHALGYETDAGTAADGRLGERQ